MRLARDSELAETAPRAGKRRLSPELARFRHQLLAAQLAWSLGVIAAISFLL